MSKEHLEIIEAAADSGGKPKVKGVAYSGGKMRIFGWSRPVVVDVNALSIPETVPILANHDNNTSCRLGLAKAKAVDGHIELDGEIVASGEIADPIVEQAKAGANWQLSIGAEVEEAVAVSKGTLVVNGIEHEAPFYHVTKATLREISVVAVGADKDTTLAIAASLTLQGASIPEPKEPGSVQGAAAPCDWEARYKGASQKINELQGTIAANAADYKTISSQLETTQQDLAAAKAENEQLKGKLDEQAKTLAAKEKDLAETRNSLSAAESEVKSLKDGRQLLTAGVLTKSDTYDEQLQAAKSPEAREAVRAKKHRR